MAPARPQPPEDPNDEAGWHTYSTLSALSWTSSALSLGWAAVCLRRGNLQYLTKVYTRGEWPPDSLVLPQELMLKGMAAECCFKAIYVYEKQQNETLTVVQLEALPWWGKHDLNEMAQQVGFELVDREPEILKALSRFVRWRGRYPTPRARSLAEWRQFKWDEWVDERAWDVFWQRLIEHAHQWSARMGEPPPEDPSQLPPPPPIL